MNNEHNDAPNRRDLLSGAAGALAAMMMQPGWTTDARAQTATLKTDPRFAFVDRISELTIPTTDTPGASAAGAPAFVLIAVDQGLNGLEGALIPSLRARLDKDAGGSFLQQSEAEQMRVLSALDIEAYAGAPATGTPEYAWRRIKAAIVAGYYTSEVGASQELVDEPVPHEFQTISLTSDFRARSNGVQGANW